MNEIKKAPVDNQDDSEIYKNILMNFLTNKELITKVQNNDMTQIINAFSLYICNSDLAYKYNLPYLPHHFKQFRAFVTGALQKYSVLQDTVTNIKESINIDAYLQENKSEDYKVSISINDFLVSDLDGKVTTCDNFSVNGAERNEKEDVFTITYIQDEIKRIRASRLHVDKATGKPDYSFLIKLTEQVMGLEAVKEKGNFDE